jgi:hypothetical protein
MPRTTMASSAASSHAAASADASDAVERLSEQQSCRAQEAVKEDSAESRTMEAMVLAAPAACSGCAARGPAWELGRVFFYGSSDRILGWSWKQIWVPIFCRPACK